MARKSTVAAGIVVTAVTVAALIVAVLVTTEVDAWKNKVSQIASFFFSLSVRGSCLFVAVWSDTPLVCDVLAGLYVRWRSLPMSAWAIACEFF